MKAVLVLATLATYAQAAPTAGGTCADQDTGTVGNQPYTCPANYAANSPATPNGVCTSVATCNDNCCKAKCPTFTACTGTTPVNKGVGVTCTTGTCNAATCCKARTCDSFTCTAPLTNKGASVACPTGTCDAPTCCQATTTTTLTPWDSSASSSGTQDSLKSSYSGSFKYGSSGDSSGSEASSGSTGSGSSGSALRLWMWLLLIGLCLLCCAICAAAAAMQKKPKKKKAAPKPAPAPEPEPELPLLAPIMPLATTSTVVPSYSMAMPATTAYAAPAYAQPAYSAGYGYAAPATTAYAGYGGYPTGTVV